MEQCGTLFLKEDKCIEVTGGDLIGRVSYRFTLTDIGRRRAHDAMKNCAYVGPAPVPLEDYVEQTYRQAVTGDGWLVIEAGTSLMVYGDLGGGIDGSPDGVPDTTDNNGDGKVDTADVAMGAKIGPLKNPPAPKETDPAVHLYRITDGYPYAFTNPFVLDRDGKPGFTAPGVKGAE